MSYLIFSYLVNDHGITLSLMEIDYDLYRFHLKIKEKKYKWHCRNKVYISKRDRPDLKGFIIIRATVRYVDYFIIHLWTHILNIGLDFSWKVAVNRNNTSSNPDHGEVYSIQHYVIKFVNDLRQIGGLLFPV